MEFDKDLQVTRSIMREKAADIRAICRAAEEILFGTTLSDFPFRIGQDIAKVNEYLDIFTHFSNKVFKCLS